MTNLVAIIILFFAITTIAQETQDDIIAKYRHDIEANTLSTFRALEARSFRAEVSGLFLSKFQAEATIKKWSCPIAFKIDSSIEYPETITDAMRYITSKTGWSFIERTDQRDYLHFKDLNGCWSYIGRLVGEQYISISGGCSFGAVVHEIAHSIGLAHEQSRLDCDSYVEVLYDNIQKDKKTQFQKTNIKNCGNYDYESIMHYGQWTFSSNGEQTIILKQDPPTNTLIGQRYMLSDNDIVHLNSLIDGPSCGNVVNDCRPDSYILVGGRHINTFSLIYNVYIPSGKDEYKSRESYQGHHFILKRDNDAWKIKYKNNIFAINYGSLCEAKWDVYIGTRKFQHDNSTYLITPKCYETNITDDTCSVNNVLPSILITLIFIILI